MAPARMGKVMPSPLASITIVDFSRYLPGPFCTWQLAQLGAQVIGVEQPPGGDPLRMTPPRDAQGESFAVRELFAARRQHLADLADSNDKARVLAFCDSADVVVESFRPGVAKRLGFGEEELRTRNKGLVYCSISGYGQTGPWRTHAGHDINYEAASGLLAHTGGSSAPTIPPLPLADLAGGSSAATAICAALVQRSLTGEGCAIDVSITESLLAWNIMQLPAVTSQHVATGQYEVPGSGMLDGGLGCYNIYLCADGEHIAVAPFEPHFFREFCSALGRDDLVKQQWALKSQPDLISELRSIFAMRSASRWIEHFSNSDICISAIDTYVNVARNPQLVSRGAIVDNGDCLTPASPFVIDGQRVSASAPRVS